MRSLGEIIAMNEQAQHRAELARQNREVHDMTRLKDVLESLKMRRLDVTIQYDWDIDEWIAELVADNILDYALGTGKTPSKAFEDLLTELQRDYERRS